MKDSDQDSKRIPKEQMTAWERWELPLLDERGNQVVEEEEVKPLTAADLAGQGLANPSAMILSLEMALRWSLDRAEAADKVRDAVARALDAGARTRDLGGSLSTEEMCNAILAEL